MPGEPTNEASQPSPGVARQMAIAQSAPTCSRPSASTPCSRRRTSARVAPKRASASGSRLMSRNSITPARAAPTSRLRCQSMPALQTGHLVLYQTVSCGLIALLLRNARSLPHDVPALVFARHEGVELRRGRAFDHHADRDQAPAHLVVGDDVVERLVQLGD